MAEFVEVIEHKARMCRVVKNCTKCDLSYDNNGKDMSCHTFMVECPKEAEKIIMAWVTLHPEPEYPSWDEAWKQLFPDAQHPDAPCLKYMLPISHPQMCGVHCHECSKRPIPADIAERLGIKPLEG